MVDARHCSSSAGEDTVDVDRLTAPSPARQWRDAISSFWLVSGHLARARDGEPRIACEPKRDGDFGFGTGVRRHAAVADHIKPGLLEPLAHRLLGEAEPAMRVLLAQEL